MRGVTMDFRKTYNKIPEKFDKWRPRYCDELFSFIVEYANIDENKKVLEIGPGTGQATEPFLKTQCDYLAIELGKEFVDFTRNKFRAYGNFDIVNGDYENYDFKDQQFDLVFSAATIQWIPETIGFSRTYELLKPGGIFAMFMTRTEYKTPNESLFNKIQDVYKEHFIIEQKYTCKLNYENVVNYGFEEFSYRDWKKTRTYDADDFIHYIGTHVDHITLKEPHKSNFYKGVRNAVLEAGNKITLNDTIALYLVKKPEKQMS